VVTVFVFRWDKDEKVPRRNRVRALLAIIPLLIIGLIFNSGNYIRDIMPPAKSSGSPSLPGSR
jgi:hypothetical protein